MQAAHIVPTPYSATSTTSDFPLGYRSWAIDINMDGRLDRVTGHANGLSVSTADPSGSLPYVVWKGSIDGSDTFGFEEGRPLADAGSWNLGLHDVDGDGDLDFTVSSSGNRDLRWYPNDGTGSFPSSSSPSYLVYSDTSAYAWVYDFAQVSSSGGPDVIIATSSSTIVYIPSSSPGVFDAADAVELPGGSILPSRTGILWMDYNNDGLMDVIAASTSFDQIVAFPNEAASAAADYTSSGSAAMVVLTSIVNPRVMRLDDFDNDGDMDIIVTSSSSSSALTVLVNNLGSLSVLNSFGFSSAPYWAAFDDIDLDGFIDVCGPYSSQVTCIMGDGPGSFGGLTYGAYSFNPTSVYAIYLNDVNGDSYPDLISFSESTGYSILVSLNRNPTGSTPFDTDRNIAIVPDVIGPFSGSRPAIGDLDGDGLLDFVVYHSAFSTTDFHVYVQAGPVSASATPAVPSLKVQDRIVLNSIQVTYPLDYDGDSDIDLLYIKNPGNGMATVNLLTNLMVENAVPPGDDPVFESDASALILGTATGNGHDAGRILLVDLENSGTTPPPDILVSFPNSGGYIARYAVGSWASPDTTTVRSIIASGVTNIKYFFLHDVNGDSFLDFVFNSFLDVVVQLATSPTPSSFINQPRTVLASLDSSIVGGNRIESFEFASLNAPVDAYPDLVVTYGRKFIVPFFGLDASGLRYSDFFPTKASVVTSRLDFDDWNGDGYLDIIHARSTRELAWVPNFGTPGSTLGYDQIAYDSLYGVSPSAILDIGGDSIDFEIMVSEYDTYPTGAIFRLVSRNTVDGDWDTSFSVLTDPLEGILDSIVPIDLDNDGYDDIVFTSTFPFARIGYMLQDRNPFLPSPFPMDDPSRFVPLGNLTSLPGLGSSTNPVKVSMYVLDDADTRPDAVFLANSGSRLNVFLALSQDVPGARLALPYNALATDPYLNNCYGTKMPAQFADLDGDGKTDLVINCGSTRTIQYALSLGPPANATTDARPWIFDDGRILITLPSQYGSLTSFVLVELGGSSGGLDIVTSSSSSALFANYLMHLGDNATHLVYSDPHPISVSQDWGQGGPSSSFYERPTSMGPGAAVASVDFDMNGAMDVLFTVDSSQFSQSIPLLNQAKAYPPSAFNDSFPGGGPARLVGNVFGFNPTSSSYGYVDELAVADLDGDGYPDWVSTSRTTGERALVSGINSQWLPPRSPATFVVDIKACGYTMACIARTISTYTAICSGDTVIIPPGTYTGCRTDGFMVIPRSVSLVGATGNREDVVFNCTNPGAPRSVLFSVSASTPDVKLTLANLTVVGAFTSKEDAGGPVAAMDAGSLTLSNVAVRDCTASSGSQLAVVSTANGFGGVVLARDNVRLLVEDSLFENNGAGLGGGVIGVIGGGFDVTLVRSQFVDNSALEYGGAFFVEQVSGASSWSLSQCLVEGNTAESGSLDDGLGRGGGASFSVLGGAFNMSLSADSSITSSTAAVSGGALFFRVAIGAAVVNLDGVIDSNAALLGNGGAVYGSVQDAGTLSIRGNGVIRDNTARLGSGGAVALLSRSLSGVGEVILSPGAVIGDNSAATHGGGLFLSGRDISMTSSSAVFFGNAASRMGGAMCTVGGASASVTGGSIVDSLAGFGAVAGAAFDEGYLQGPTNARGFPIETSSSALTPDAGVASCGARGAGVRMSGVALERNMAVYGALGFSCGTPVSILMDSGGSYVFDRTKTVGGIDPVAGGAFFTCAPAAGACGGAGDPCCLGSSNPELLSAPWVSGDAGFFQALNGTLGVLNDVYGYGAVVGMPITSLTWISIIPPAVSSGAPFSDGLVSVVDGLGQGVVDPQVSLSIGFVSSAGSEGYAVVGTGAQQLVLESTVSFAGVGLAVRLGSPIGVAVDLAIGVGKAAYVTPDTTLTATVVLSACLPGSGSLVKPGSSVVECSVCLEGTFSNETSLGPCRSCPSSIVVTGTGATECLSCPSGSQLLAGFVPTPGSGLNCTCIPGFYTLTRSQNVVCAPCVEGASCQGGIEVPVALPGWYPTDDAGVFLACPNPSACQGGYPFRCKEGYEGKLCGACTRGYYTLSGSCYKCDDRTIPLLTAAAVVLLLFVWLLVWLNAKEDVSYRFAAVMIGFNSLQISAMYAQLELGWSDFSEQFFNVISFVNLNFDLSSPECATVTDNVWLLKWWLTVLLPVLFLIPFAIVMVGYFLYSRFKERAGHDTMYTRYVILDAGRRAYLQIMVLLSLPLASMALSYFRCRRDRTGRWVLEASPSKSCWVDWHWQLLGAAIVFGLLYVVGIPLFVAVLLTRLQKRSDPTIFVLRYSFLVARFAPTWYRFEVWIMLRKVSVALCMAAFRTVNNKANSALFFLGMSLLQLVRVQPYIWSFHNGIAVLCLSTCIVILWAGTFEDKFSQTFAAISAISINLLAIVVGVVVDAVYIWRGAKEAEESFKGEQTEQFDDMETFASVDMTGIHLEHMVVADTGGSGMGMGMGDDSDSSATFATPVQFDSMQGLDGGGSSFVSTNPVFAQQSSGPPLPPKLGSGVGFDSAGLSSGPPPPPPLFVPE